MGAIVERTWKDRVEEHLPRTFGQFQTVLDGKPNRKPGYGIYSKAWMRRKSAMGFAWKLGSIPFDITIRTPYNGAFTIYKICLLSTSIFMLIFQHDEPRRRKTLQALISVGDGFAVFFLSPTQAAAKATRLFIAIIAPQTLYKDPNTLAVNRRLQFSVSSLIRQLDLESEKSLILNDNSSIDEAKLYHATILTACFKYLLKESILFSPKIRKEKDEFKDDLNQEIRVVQKFLKVLNDHFPSDTQLENATDPLENFFRITFVTSIQRSYLTKFFSSITIEELIHLSTYHNCYKNNETRKEALEKRFTEIQNALVCVHPSNLVEELSEENIRNFKALRQKELEKLSN